MSFAYGREKSLPLVYREIAMRESRTNEISVFVDESGSFEPDEESSRFYLVCLVFHDQSVDISPWIGNLETFLETHGLGARHCIHVGPLIRREREYEGMLREERTTNGVSGRLVTGQNAYADRSIFLTGCRHRRRLGLRRP